VRGSGVKLLGALLVIGGAAALGHLEAVRREKRARELAAVITALELLESHVVYGQVLLADALRRVGEAQPGAGWAFLRAAERLEEGWPASRALRESFSAWAARSALLESDLAPLVHLAPVLGLSEGGDQARHLRWARSQLEVKLAGARQRLPEVARLCRALGVCGGLILALLLY